MFSSDQYATRLLHLEKELDELKKALLKSESERLSTENRLIQLTHIFKSCAEDTSTPSKQKLLADMAQRIFKLEENFSCFSGVKSIVGNLEKRVISLEGRIMKISSGSDIENAQQKIFKKIEKSSALTQERQNIVERKLKAKINELQERLDQIDGKPKKKFYRDTSDLKQSKQPKDNQALSSNIYSALASQQESLAKRINQLEKLTDKKVSKINLEGFESFTNASRSSLKTSPTRDPSTKKFKKKRPLSALKSRPLKKTSGKASRYSKKF